MRHHFLDGRRGGRARFVDFFTPSCRTIKATNCKRSSTRKGDRPADVTSNGLGVATLVQAVGRRLSLPARSWK
jgi:hypothetical protein